MYFDTTFFLAEFCPPEYGQTQINGCRIEGIDVPSEFKDFRGSLLSCFVYQVVGILFKDVIVSILIGSCQR